MIKHRTGKRLSSKSTYAWKLEGTLLVPKHSEKSILMTRKLQLITRGLLGQLGLERHLQPVLPGWHGGCDKDKDSEGCLTLLVEAEVLQGLVEVPGRGDSTDVAVGADGAQPGRAGPVPHRGQAPALWGEKRSTWGWSRTQPRHSAYFPANQ